MSEACEGRVKDVLGVRVEAYVSEARWGSGGRVEGAHEERRAGTYQRLLSREVVPAIFQSGYD